MVKMTFTFDEATVARLRRVSSRLSRPQSQVVREAIREYDERSGTLGDEERRRLLEAFDRLVPLVPGRPAREVEAELREIRAARRESGKRRARVTDR